MIGVAMTPSDEARWSNRARPRQVFSFFNDRSRQAKPRWQALPLAPICEALANLLASAEQTHNRSRNVLHLQSRRNAQETHQQDSRDAFAHRPREADRRSFADEIHERQADQCGIEALLRGQRRKVIHEGTHSSEDSTACHIDGAAGKHAESGPWYQRRNAVCIRTASRRTASTTTGEVSGRQ